jgi:methenyltetrahydromethanopterin cyclohydrolase
MCIRCADVGGRCSHPVSVIAILILPQSPDRQLTDKKHHTQKIDYTDSLDIITLALEQISSGHRDEQV